MKTITLLILLLPAIALAHITPDHTSPAVGSTVTTPPTEVKIWYDGPVGVSKSHVDVTDANGQSLTDGALHGDEKDNTLLVIPIAAAHGKVSVKWTAYCPECNHTTHGTFTFTVAP